MELTKYASNNILRGEIELRTTMQADIKIVFDHQKKGKKVFADVFIVERNTNLPIFIVEEGIPIHDRAELTIQSPDGLVCIPVELKSNE